LLNKGSRATRNCGGEREEPAEISCPKQGDWGKASAPDDHFLRTLNVTRVARSQPEGAVTRAFELAAERYAAIGVDARAALDSLAKIEISLPCWQGDDLTGFERDADISSSGLAVTGNHPGKARTPEDLRIDAAKAFSLIPARRRFNLHAIYLDAPRPIPRNELLPEHFQSWIDWAKATGTSLDFNPSYFAHPHAADGFTLAHRDGAIRKFWIEHGIACRRIGGAIGKQLGSPCITNSWIPDGYKDCTIDRRAPRERLAASLDAIFAEPLDATHNRDAVESKLFGIGTEDYVVGSHEFYLGYAITRKKILCLDSGHFHPTENLADKISAVLLHVPAILLHLSRGVRWDSDHVVTWSDDLTAICRELVRGDFLGRTHLGLDFFDASINRVAAWVIGARSVLKALLFAFLEPVARLRICEAAGDFTTRLALIEELRTLPFGAVWDMACESAAVPRGETWIDEVKAFEVSVQSPRA
jgi:L-rhamnose isomerase